MTIKERPAPVLRVATYNVRGCVGMDRQRSESRIAEVIASMSADVVGLQELDAKRKRSSGVDQAALIAESFTGRLRYSGASLGYQLASVIAGGPAPLIAAWLFGVFGSPYAIAGYILFCALLSIAATAMISAASSTSTSPDRQSRASNRPAKLHGTLLKLVIARAAVESRS